MNTSVKVAGFLVGLGAVFALALGVGNALGPDVQPEPAPHDTHTP